MIAVDTNLLVYAHREDSHWHSSAYRIIKDLAESPRAWAIAWPCLHEFLAIATHPRIYAPPTPLPRALEQIDAWVESPTLHLLSESDRSWEAMRALFLTARVAGPLVHDARVAALCEQYGVTELWSADRDFSRFPSLRVRNPLVA